jgi:glycosyltransferase involved in cell wall biosynthesis
LPDEVLIVLKPSKNGSEYIIKNYRDKLPIKVVIQNKGNVVDAFSLAIKEAKGDIVIFMDDDAIAKEDFVKRYETMFRILPKAGAIGGLVLKAYMINNNIMLTKQKFYKDKSKVVGPHRKKMDIFKEYDEWLSTSGFHGKFERKSSISKSVALTGCNMGILRKSLRSYNINELYFGSKIGFHYESLIAYMIRIAGYHIYLVNDPNISPIVWHIEHPSSLTRGNNFEKEFWIQFDKALMFWRLRTLKAQVSLFRYLLALIISARIKPVPRILATIKALYWSSLLRNHLRIHIK